ncbi:hypothetical protein AXF42_Ash010030 [Apostasia shenzhenica]|uniref:Uncharacterized protein n=1 Tax=Apostasia shenzhenica TaxID=1088818 RepID=A0A2I0ACN6_9ASPA|nr:hypothetical protein AXF42_Ash010030 [Apostasia shenzhenica]
MGSAGRLVLSHSPEILLLLLLRLICAGEAVSFRWVPANPNSNIVRAGHRRTGAAGPRVLQHGPSAQAHLRVRGERFPAAARRSNRVACQVSRQQGRNRTGRAADAGCRRRRLRLFGYFS